MNIKDLIGLFLRGWKIIFKSLYNLVHKICTKIKEFFEKLCSKKKEDSLDKCCLKVPDSVRAQPDPMIYSQEWLMKRNLAVTWNNPDFKIADINGNIINSHELKPNTTYKILVTFHNNSVMAAINSIVTIEILPFGISSGIIIGSTTLNHIDIFAFGSTTVEFKWHTPNNVGHICLKARVFHPDDANPFNNVGQHNTVIVNNGTIVNDEIQIDFKIHNKYKTTELINFQFNSYQLPKKISLPENIEQRNSIKYLRTLQAIHNIKEFHLDPNEYKIAILGLNQREHNNHNESIIEGQKEYNLTIKLPINNQILPSIINVNVFYKNGELLGGFSIQNNLI